MYRQAMKKDSIIRYINGNANPEERMHIEQWRKEDLLHEKEYLDIKEMWEMTELKKEVPDIDVNRAWDNFIHLRNERVAGRQASVRNINLKKKLWWGAASIAILGIVSFWLIRPLLSDDLHLETANQFQHHSLPDGSSVHLNKNTDLYYHQGWRDKNRQVYIRRGEAFFDVQKDAKRPFVIKSGNTRITVLGTSFHVRREQFETEVIVASGSVKVNHADQEIVLKPEQSVIVSDTSRLALKVDTVPDHLYRYYIHQQFVFENTSLARVFATLSKAYDVEFVIDNPKTAQLPLTVTFEQQTLSEMLLVITKTFNLNIEKKKNKYHIN